MVKQRLMSLLMLFVMLLGSSLPAMAQTHYYRGYSHRYYDNYAYNHPFRVRYQRFNYRHPYVTKAAIGGGVGALAGSLLAPEGRHGDGAVKGALIGAGIGMGYQFLKNRNF